MIGQTIAHYRVTARLGAGGMGEVYRATDTKLGRDVALKVLPPAFAQNTQRMQRFQREAQVLASLNHPNIATLHGLEEADGTQALAMELVEGPTLAERIASGAIALVEALPLAKQIAEALEYAHERGIIHRDLKPANIKLTSENQVKVLDFGLAKAMAGDQSAPEMANSPTLSFAATQAGIILGTAAYMSPEQARGKAADRRADIWAFGVVLYEMLSGRQLYGGETASDSMAAVITREPDWAALPAGLPRRLRELLRRCLIKDPRNRLRDIGDARIALEEILADPGERRADTSAAVTAAAPGGPLWRRALPWVLAGVLAIVSGVAVWRAGQKPPAAVQRLEISLPPGGQYDPGPNPTLAVSPDGRYIVYSASFGSGWSLYLRRLDEFDHRGIPGTEDGGSPFFSPDGKWLGYIAQGFIKKYSLESGTSQNIAIAPGASQGRGATWGSDGQVVFSISSYRGLQQVAAIGGEPKELTRPDESKQEVGHRLPEFLPGGKAVLFTVETIAGTYNNARIAVLSLKTGKWHTVVEGGMSPHYSSTGHILFVRDNRLMAIPFDLGRLETTGPAVPVVEQVMANPSTGVAQLAVSSGGTLVYLPFSATAANRNVVWADRKGGVEALPIPPDDFNQPSLAAQGKSLALHNVSGGNDVWTYDLARGSMTRITFQGDEDETPLWMPDGRKVVYSSSVGNTARGIYWKNGDGSGEQEQLATVGNHAHLSSISRDGKWLAYTLYESETRADICLLSLTGERKSEVYLKTPFNEREGKISPDGRFMAYASDESGRDEIFVQTIPSGGGKWQVSVEGGFGPLWSPTGKELFFRNENKVMAVAYSSTPTFAPSPPRVLFEGRFEVHPRREGIYDVSGDGQRFLMIKTMGQDAGFNRLNVVVNWAEELNARAPVK